MSESGVLHHIGSTLKYIITRLQSEFILVFVLALLGGCGYAAYIIAMQLKEAVSDQMSKQNKVSMSSKGISIKVKDRPKEKTVESAQRFAYKAWLNSKAPDTYKGHLKYREHEDRRKIDHAAATAGANAGWA